MKYAEKIMMYIFVGYISLLILIGVVLMFYATYEIHPLLSVWCFLFLSSFAYLTTKGDLT